MTGGELGRMTKRRMKPAGLPERLSPDPQLPSSATTKNTANQIRKHRLSCHSFGRCEFRRRRGLVKAIGLLRSAIFPF